MTPALVSVIIPAYNGGPWIGETLESVLRQTHERLQIIVVDDGSTDDTVERVRRVDHGIELVQQANAGCGAALNAGLRRAAGDYVALLATDDLWLPEKLSTQLAIAARHAESGIIVCDGVEFDGDVILAPRLFARFIAGLLAGSPEGEVTADFFSDLLRAPLIACPAQTLIPRRVIEETGPLTREEPSDWDYYLRIAARYPFTFHGHDLVRRRYVPSGLSGPMEHRAFVWGLMGVRMLKRHRRAGTFGQSEQVAAALRGLVRSTARTAYYYGREHDAAFARSYLLTLGRLFPSATVAMHLAALCFPEPFVSWVRRIARPWLGSGQARKP